MSPANSESLPASSVKPAINFISGADRHIRRRLLLSQLFAWACRLATYAALAILVVLLAAIFYSSIGRLAWDFVTNTNSTNPAKAGMLAGLWGSFWLILFTAMFSIPVGVGSAVYLEEIAKDSFLVRIIKINLANLAGVPSIVYGILGYTVFRSSAAVLSRLFDGNCLIGVMGLFKIRLMKLPIYEDNILVGALTLTLVILPTVIAASQEALRSVPSSIRVASRRFAGSGSDPLANDLASGDSRFTPRYFHWRHSVDITCDR